MPEAAYPGDLLLHLASFVALLGHLRSGGARAFESAARDLHVDRSVLRRRIQALASWAEVPLLAGRGSHLEATDGGKRLAERAEQMLTIAKDLKGSLSSSNRRVTLACTGTITTELVPQVLLDLEKRARDGGLELAVRRAGGAACERLVARGAVDLGIVRADEPPPGFASAPVTEDRLWFVLPRAHPLLARRRLTLRAMAEVPLVLYGEASRTRARVMERLGPFGAKIRVEVDGRTAALEYVRLGLGATFVSLMPRHRLSRAHHARDVTAHFSPCRFFVIAKPSRWSDPAVATIVERLVYHARRAPPV